MQNDYGDGDIFFSIIVEKTKHTYYVSSVANFNTLARSEIYPLSFDCNFISTYYVDWSPMFSVCLNNAPNFYMKIGIDNVTSMISECTSGCTLCGSNGKCKKCSSEFYLYHETCLGCDSSCVNCKELSFNCSLCPNLIQMVKYSNTFVNYEICENCELPGCKVCLHNVCLICADQFTLIKNDCIDCTKQKNKEICFPEKKDLYISPFIREYRSFFRESDILEYSFVSCDDSDDVLQCESCAKAELDKFGFIECFHFPDRHAKKQALKETSIQIHEQENQSILDINTSIKKLDTLDKTPVFIEHCAFSYDLSSSCLLCMPGFFIQNQACAPCKAGCLKCSSHDDCVTCFFEYSKVKEKNQITCKHTIKKNKINKSKCIDLRLHLPNLQLAQSKIR